MREYFCRSCKCGKLKGVYDVGTFWYDEPKSKTNGEFDCVLQVEDGYKIYEVKNYTRPMTKVEMQQEAQQVEALASFIKIAGMGFVAASGFEDGLQGYEQLTLDDLYDFRKVRS